jgi:hypothetical protein
MGVIVAGRFGIAGLSLALYAFALALPALHFVLSPAEERIFAGWEALAMGWYAVLGGNAGWLANAPYFGGLILMLAGLRRTSLALGLVALVCALHTFRLLGTTWDADEGGVRHMVMARFDVAPYLWMAAMVVMLPGAFLFRNPPGGKIQFVPRKTA